MCGWQNQSKPRGHSVVGIIPFSEALQESDPELSLGPSGLGTEKDSGRFSRYLRGQLAHWSISESPKPKSAGPDGSLARGRPSLPAPHPLHSPPH